MKKILSVILAVAMVLGCVAALAFVIDPGTGTAPTSNPFQVEDFHVTDSTAIVAGVRVYSDLVNMNGQPYDKNSVIRFAVDMTVKNPTNPSNGVQPAAATGDNHALLFESKTVDFALSAAQGGMALYAPYYVKGFDVTNLVNVTLSPANAAEWTPETGILKVPVTVYTHDGAPMDTTDVAKSAFGKSGLVLYGQSDKYTVVKTDFTLVLTGVTKGELTDEGLVTLKVLDQAAVDFKASAVTQWSSHPALIVTKNGRTYAVVKDVNSHSWADKVGVGNYGDLYTVKPVTYDIALSVGAGADGKVGTADDVFAPIAGFETEEVKYNKAYFGEDMSKMDVPNVGKSLGLVYWDGKGIAPSYNMDRVVRQTLDGYNYSFFNLDDGKGTQLFTADGKIANPDGSGDIIPEMVGTMTKRAALEQLMADFGFSYDVNNTYKITDSIFTSADTYEVLATADYNGNAVVIPQDPDEGDVEEGTDDEELPEEGDIDEEIPDEGDIDEEIPDEGDVEPEPVPETGDASTAVAIALTAAALVAATGFAVVMKKAR